MRSSNYIRYYSKLAFFAVILILSVGCRKLVDVDTPPSLISTNNVYTSDATAIAVLNGIYDSMSQSSIVTSSPTSPGLSLLSGLSADEFVLFSGVSNTAQIQYYKNALTTNKAGYEMWNNSYPLIFRCNDAIQGLTNSSGLTPAIKQQLLGEAKFLRAFFYFYLTNLYGDVPLVLTTDYKLNAIMPRTAKNLVYQQIITDLKEAQASLNTNFLDGTLLKFSSDRVRPTNWAATALLARVYLYFGNLTMDQSYYSLSISQSSQLINNTATFKLTTLNQVFLKASAGNNEAIWQLQPVATSPTNTSDGALFVIPATGPSATLNPVYLSTSLLNAFESGDQRKLTWVSSVTTGGNTYYFPFKYKIGQTTTAPVSEYTMIMRLGEQYLIRAEAEANTNDLINAANDLNAIRSRAGLPNTTATSQSTLQAAITHERQVELFGELGHRWLDLKRTGQIDLIMQQATLTKGGTWSSYQQLYPLPISDLQADPSLIQNPGY